MLLKGSLRFWLLFVCLCFTVAIVWVASYAICSRDTLCCHMPKTRGPHNHGLKLKSQVNVLLHELIILFCHNDENLTDMKSVNLCYCSLSMLASTPSTLASITYTADSRPQASDPEALSLPCFPSPWTTMIESWSHFYTSDNKINHYPSGDHKELWYLLLFK